MIINYKQVLYTSRYRLRTYITICMLIRVGKKFVFSIYLYYFVKTNTPKLGNVRVRLWIQNIKKSFCLLLPDIPYMKLITRLLVYHNNTNIIISTYSGIIGSFFRIHSMLPNIDLNSNGGKKLKEGGKPLGIVRNPINVVMLLWLLVKRIGLLLIFNLLL